MEEVKKRVMPVLIKKLELTGDYEGWWFKARTNPKMQIFNLLMTGTYNGMVVALSELAVGEWNFVDEEGEPLAQPHLTRQNYERYETDLAKWQKNGRKKDPPEKPISPQDLVGQLTIDLVMEMSKAVGAAIQEVPGN